MARSKKDMIAAYKSTFPTRLRALMHERSMKQDALAEIVGKTRQTVSQYVNGESEPGYETLIKIANAFDVSTDYLLGLTPNPTTDKDVDAICQYTGLSDKAVQKLHDFKTDAEFGAYLIQLLNHLLLDPRFTHELTYRINKYCDAYLAFQQGIKERATHQALVSELTNGDITIEIDLLEKGILTKSVSDRELSSISDLKDLSRFQVQRAFDNVLDCLTFHYCKKNGCDLDGTYRKK